MKLYLVQRPRQWQQPPDILRMIAGSILMEQYQHYTGFLIEMNENDEQDTAGAHHAIGQIEAIRIARRMIASSKALN